MDYLDIDFAIPIALLLTSIVGVVLVRMAAARGARRAKARTRRLLEASDGMRETDRASTD